MILALDTSTEACSAALLVDTKIFSRFEIKPNQHSHLILPMIESLLVEANLEKKQLNAIAFGVGPGSFTGLRIAASVAQGMAFALNLPVIPVSSLQTLAQTVYEASDHKKIQCAIDAHAGSFYHGTFIWNKNNNLMEISGTEQLIDPKNFIFPKDKEDWHYVGSGWQYFQLSKTSSSSLLSISETDILSSTFPSSESQRSSMDNSLLDFIPMHPKASAMIPLAKQAFLEGKSVSPEDALPVYLHELNYLKS